MPNVEPLTLELADRNEPVGVPNYIDGNGQLHDFLNDERLARRPAPDRNDAKRGQRPEGLNLTPPIGWRKWCPRHLEAIGLGDTGICPICMVAPKPVCASTASMDGHVRPVDCKDGTLLNAGRVRDQDEFGAAVPRHSQPIIRCPVKAYGAPSAPYASGSFLDRTGKRDFLFHEATCINGHSKSAYRLCPEDAEPEPSAVEAAAVAPGTRAMFDHVVETRYRELLRIAENALDGGRISGDEDCVQRAVEALLRDGSYAACANEGQMFGQLVVTVLNRTKETIKRRKNERKKHRSIATEAVRRRSSHDGDDEIVGEGAAKEISSDSKGVDEAIDAALRPKPAERTRDLWLDAKRTLFDVAVPLEKQMVLVGELTRKEVLAFVADTRDRHIRTKIFDDHIAACRERLAKHLDDYSPAPGQKREWRDGRWVSDSGNEARYFQRRSANLRERWGRLLARRDSAFHRFSVTPLSADKHAESLAACKTER